SHALRSQFQATDFRLVVLPGGCGNPLGGFLQGSVNADWAAFWDNGAAANYLAAYDGSPTFLCTPGRAFWVLHNGPVIVSGTLPTAGLDTTRSVAIPLHQGWNLIGNPFTTPVSWSWVQAVNGPGPIAVPWSYNGTFQQATTLLPYQGYLFDNTNSLTVLRIPFGRTLGKVPAAAGELGMGPVITGGSPSSPAPGGQSPASQAPAGEKRTGIPATGDWHIGITLTSGNTIDRSASIGVSPDAKEGRDPLDLRMPRGVGTIPGVFFTRPGWDRDGSVFAADVRPEISSLECWPADVRAPVGQTAVLSFSGIENVPGAFGVMLIDDEADRTADLRKSPSYTFTPGVPVSRFRIVVGTPESLQGVLQDVAPKDFALEKNFPNPFNPSTTITVDIPRTSTVSLTIYSILGAEVETLYSGQIDAGRHFYVWNGTDRQGRPVSSGVYVVRLKNEAGRSFVTKMLLLR
ncbi:MAG TPA: FlgD immunoglobulin-like domain containing protein, partial [Bacteroidota bacterium]|nr:FlgD immunoglobulin-like domain containing protein [Bacteroidota bacterium]